jgi:molybdopterin converting factor small subunit
MTMLDESTVSTATIRFYGRLAEELQPELSLTIPSEGITVAELRKVLAGQLDAPRLLDRTVRVAAGDEIVRDEHLILPGQLVDILAPLSGG